MSMQTRGSRAHTDAASLAAVLTGERLPRLRDVFGVDTALLPDRGYVSGFKTPYDTIAVERRGTR
jgi:hypothetical protein